MVAVEFASTEIGSACRYIFEYLMGVVRTKSVTLDVNNGSVVTFYARLEYITA